MARRPGDLVTKEFRHVHRLTASRRRPDRRPAAQTTDRQAPIHRRRPPRHDKTERNATVTEATPTQTVLDVPDITCGHCERAITAALGYLAGVERVAVDIPARRVRVAYDPARVDLAGMTAVLAEEGYPVASAAPAGQPEAASEPVPAAGCSCCGSRS